MPVQKLLPQEVLVFRQPYAKDSTQIEMQKASLKLRVSSIQEFQFDNLIVIHNFHARTSQQGELLLKILRWLINEMPSFMHNFCRYRFRIH